MIEKRPGDTLDILARLAYVGPSHTYRYEVALGACGLGGCGMPGSGFTIEPFTHKGKDFLQKAAAEAVPGNASVRISFQVPVIPYKIYDMRVWITDPANGYKVLWEVRIADAVKIFPREAPPPAAGVFSNGPEAIVIS